VEREKTTSAANKKAIPTAGTAFLVWE